MSQESEEEVPKYLRPVTAVQAFAVIEATKSGGRAKRIPSADPERLASGIQRLQLDYAARHQIDRMPDLSVMETLFKRLADATKSVQRAFDDILASSWTWYFLVVALPHPKLDEEQDLVEFEATQALMQRLRGYLNVALGEVAAARGNEGSRRWYEHEEGKAEAWLWGVGLPSLYKETFGLEYSIPSSEEDTRPGLRFAHAVLEVGGLPVTGHHNLRRHWKRWAKPKGGIEAPGTL